MKNNQLHGIIGLTFRATTNMPNKGDQSTVEILDKVRTRTLSSGEGISNMDNYLVMITDTNELCGKVTTIRPDNIIELIKK